MNLKGILEYEYKLRFKKNPKYSLRSFARWLEIDPSLLSKFLNGNREISPRLRVQIAEKLNISKDLIKDKKSLALTQLDDTLYKILKNPIYDFFLESFQLDDFQPRKTWFAEKFKIGMTAVSHILQDLLQANLISIDQDGELIDLTNGYSTHLSPNGKTSEAKKTYQRKITQNAYLAIDKFDYSDRDHSSLIVATDEELLPILKDSITKFRKELAGIMSQSKKKILFTRFQSL